MYKKKVSILIPLYNAESYIAETLESLLAQSYENIEIIVVDDGSSDGSLKIAKEYEKEYEHIKVYTQKNSGASATRNKAFEMSSGEYIQYFDADDIMHSDKIASQMKVLEKYGFEDNIVATGKWVTFTDSIEKTLYIPQVINKDYDDTFLYFRESWESGAFIIGPSWLIPRNLNVQIGGWDIQLSMNDDGEFFTRVAYASDKMIFIEESLVYYRKGIGTSISSSKSSKGRESLLNSYRAYHKLVENDVEKHFLHKGLASLYSQYYAKYFPLEKKEKEKLLTILNNLGYDEPIVRFNTALSLVSNIFGVDAAIFIRKMRDTIKLSFQTYQHKKYGKAYE